jgi:putative SOS response-associated peptidase YedK
MDGSTTPPTLDRLACEDVPLVPFPVKRMSVRPVNRWVNNVRNQGPQCIEPPT